MKKIIHKISSESDELEILLLGIVTFETEHKMCWALNEKLEVNLKIYEEDEILYYVFEDNLKYYLIPNKSNNSIQFPEIKNIDFILKITGKNLSEIKVKSVKLLKTISFINAVVEIDTTKLKQSKKKLISL